MPEYTLSQAFPGERARLEAMALGWNPPSRRLISQLGIGPGAACLEAGAGTGTMTRWLSELVGPTGRVLAVDRDPRFLTEMPANVEVAALDVRHDGLPLEQFDLVYARLLVEHLPPQEHALERLLRPVRRGGWLLIEDADMCTIGWVSPPSSVHEKIMSAVLDVMRAGGYEPYYGRRLFHDIRNLGLVDTASESHGFQVVSDGASSWAPWQLIVEQMTGRIIESGLVSQDDIDAWWELSRDGRSIGSSPIMVAAWGRKP